MNGRKCQVSGQTCTRALKWSVSGVRWLGEKLVHLIVYSKTENLALFLDCSYIPPLSSFPRFTHSPLSQIILFLLSLLRPPLNYFGNFPVSSLGFWSSALILCILCEYISVSQSPPNLLLLLFWVAIFVCVFILIYLIYSFLSTHTPFPARKRGGQQRMHSSVLFLKYHRP